MPRALLLALSALALAGAQTTCSSCVGSSNNKWCGGASQTCISSSQTCPEASGGLYCAATSSYLCSSLGASTCPCTTTSGTGSSCCGLKCTSTSTAYYFLAMSITGLPSQPAASDVPGYIPTLQSIAQAALGSLNSNFAAVTVTVTRVTAGSNTLYGSRLLQGSAPRGLQNGAVTVYLTATLTPSQAALLVAAMPNNFVLVPSALFSGPLAGASAAIVPTTYVTASGQTLAYSTSATSYTQASQGGANPGPSSDFTNTEGTNSKISGGVAASLVIAAALSLAALCGASRCPCKGAPDARAKAWHARANRSRCCLSLGVVAGIVGILAGIAAPAIPWMSYSAMGGLLTLEQTTLSTTMSTPLGSVTINHTGDMVNGTYLA